MVSPPASSAPCAPRLTQPGPATAIPSQPEGGGSPVDIVVCVCVCVDIVVCVCVCVCVCTRLLSGTVLIVGSGFFFFNLCIFI